MSVLLHFLQVGQGDAVQVFIDHLVQPLPQGEGPAVAGFFTAVFLPLQTGDCGQAALSQTDDLPGGVCLGGAAKTVAAALTPDGVH